MCHMGDSRSNIKVRVSYELRIGTERVAYNGGCLGNNFRERVI